MIPFIFFLSACYLDSTIKVCLKPVYFFSSTLLLPLTLATIIADPSYCISLLTSLSFSSDLLNLFSVKKTDTYFYNMKNITLFLFLTLCLKWLCITLWIKTKCLNLVCKSLYIVWPTLCLQTHLLPLWSHVGLFWVPQIHQHFKYSPASWSSACVFFFLVCFWLQFFRRLALFPQ